MKHNLVPIALITALGITVVACNSTPNASSEPETRLETQAVVGSWSSLNPGAGGQIQAVTLDPYTENRAFLLSDVEGIYVSNNGGGNWQYTGNGLAATDTLSLAVAPYTSGNASTSRVYLGTSMGLHRSFNGGQTWERHPEISYGGSKAQVTNATIPGTFTDIGFGPEIKMSIGSVTIDPKNAQTVVVGLGSRRWSWVNQATVYKSTNNGQNFSKITFGSTGGNNSILQLAIRKTVAPAVTQLFAAAGAGGLWRSNDFGSTWSQLAKPVGALGRAESVAVSENGDTVYAVYGNGAFDSTGASNPSAASKIYTIRTANLTTGSSSTTNANWKALNYAFSDAFSAADPGLNDASSYLNQVALDPQSTTTTQRILTAAAGSSQRKGLVQGKVTWSGATPSVTWNRVFYFNKRQGAPNPELNAPYDIGWEGGIFGNRPQPRSFMYSPLTWATKQIWTTGDQTVFKTNLNASDRDNLSFKDTWQQLYSVASSTVFPELNDFTAGGDKVVNVGWTPANTFNESGNIFRIPSLGPIKQYKSNGLASSVDTDADMYGNIVISSKGDHGLTTSYDGGEYWENVSQPRRAKSQSNLLVKVANQPKLIALAHFTDAFDFGATGGAGNANGELWAREIDLNTPGPGGWYYLAGGKAGVGAYESYSPAGTSDQRLGLPNDFYTNIISDPTDVRRVYVTTKNSGIYRIDNIEFLFCLRRQVQACVNNAQGQPNALPFATQITGSNVRANEYEGSAVIDPNKPNFMYVADNQFLKRVNLTNGSVETLRQNGNASTLVNIGAWNSGGTTYLASSQDQNDVWLTKVGPNNELSWVRVFNKFDLINARPQPTFSNSAAVQNRLIVHAIEGSGNKIYATLQVQDPENIGYGIFEISFNSSLGRTGIADITGNHYFPKSFRTEVVTNPTNNKKYLLMSSWGAGLWRIELQ